MSETGVQAKDSHTQGNETQGLQLNGEALEPEMLPILGFLDLPFYS